METFRTVTAHLRSNSPYSPSYFLQSIKNDGETDREFEMRVFRERIHHDGAGHVVIPANQFSTALKKAASYLNLKIPGERNRTFTKHFDSGVRVDGPLVLPDLVAEVEGEWLMLHSQPGSVAQTKVQKCMPKIPAWAGEVRFIVLDPKITKDVFREVLVFSGSQIGVGRWRPERKGEYGRFSIESFEWKE